MNIKKKPYILLVSSMKGGVGKSTVASNLAAQLAVLGKKTLICDLDFDVRSLDLIMGYEDRMVFDLADVISGRCTFSDAAVVDTGLSNLFFLGAPFEYKDSFDEEYFAKEMRRIGEENGFDYIILDTPGANTPTLAFAKKASDTALIVTSHNPASIRGAEKSARVTESEGLETYLIINGFDVYSVLEDERRGIIELIDQTRVRLIGVVPQEKMLAYAQEKGILALTDRFICRRAFTNIASRIVAVNEGGKMVPILKGVKGVKDKRKKLLVK